MNFRTIAPTLPAMDGLSYDTLVLTHFDDERPLRGVGGLVDWRLNGKFSQLLLDRSLTGEWGEQLLYPQSTRLTFDKILYVGLGERSRFGSSRYRETSHKILRTLSRIGVWSFALSLPGRDTLKLVPRQLTDLWLGELQKVFVSQRFHDLKYEVGLLEPPEIHAEITEQLDEFVRQHTP